MTLAEDRELIQALQIAPRASWRALGGALHRSPAALAQRWTEMVEQGLAWCTAVPFGSDSAGVTSFIAQLAKPGSQQALIRQLAQIPEVVSIEVPARHWDIILTVLTPGIEDLMQRIQPRIAALDGLARQETPSYAPERTSPAMNGGSTSWTPQPARGCGTMTGPLRKKARECAKGTSSCYRCSCATGGRASATSPRNWTCIRARCPGG